MVIVVRGMLFYAHLASVDCWLTPPLKQVQLLELLALLSNNVHSSESARFWALFEGRRPYGANSDTSLLVPDYRVISCSLARLLC